MFRKYILPALAVLGVAFAIYMVRTGAKATPIAAPVADPPQSPFAYFVAGSGLVEASTENIAVGSPIAGVVKEVYRKVGDPVYAGLPSELYRRIAPRVIVDPAPDGGDEPPPATRPIISADSPERVDLNRASVDQLAALPGIGTTWARRIVQMRPIASADDLRGTPLFKLDDRALRADLVVKQAAAAQASGRLSKLLQGTRDEEVRVAEAQLDEAVASLADAKRMFETASTVTLGVVSTDELESRRMAVKVNEARVRRTQANLELLKAGTWEPDLAIARTELASAEAQVSAAQTEIERLTVRAEVDGKVLQVKVRPGEFAAAGVMATPLMLLGQTDVLHIRVDIDENEALRVRATADAVASVRGDSSRQAHIKCVRIEPYIIPKKSLTGDSTERVDTRVLQILYAFDPHDLHAYVGQQMDVFIDAAPASAPATRSTTRGP